MASIELDVFLAHPPAKVWRALTDPELIERWLMPNDFEPVVGHRFTFRRPMRGDAGVVRCQVIELDPQEKLTITWSGQRTARTNPVDTTISWRLVPEGHGTRLFFTHAGFDPADPEHQTIMEIMSGGWRDILTKELVAIAAEVS